MKRFYQFSPIMRPVRLFVLAYSYVLTGTKVEKPHRWQSI